MFFQEKKIDLKVSDIFDIEGGVKINFNHNPESQELKMISPAMIPKTNYHPITDNFIIVNASNVKPNKFLKPNDYLISPKQLIKGYSLLNTDNIEGNKVIASEHLIILRYKPTWSAIFVQNSYFMHNLLDLLVVQLDEYATKKTELKNQSEEFINNKFNMKKGFQKFITIDEVANSKISFDISDYKEVDEIYNNIKRLIKKEIDLVNDFKIKFNQIIEKNNISIRVTESSYNIKKPISDEYVFYIKLGTAYYNQPFLNVKTEYQDKFGEHQSLIEVHLENWNSSPIRAKINRNANPNQSPRIMFIGTDYNKYVQSKYKIGEYISISIDENIPVKRILIK
jgi:hypothetical protein